MNDKAKNVIHAILKVILSLILIVPIFGATGIFPEPTREQYNTELAFNFIQTLMNDASYIQYIIALVFALCIVLLWTKREALASFLIAPITINIVGFHLFLDGGLFTGGAIMGNLLLVLNIYFLWKNKGQYDSLLMRQEK
jgi:putative oxidoreductase